MAGFTTSETVEHVWPAYTHALSAALRVLKSKTAQAGSYEYSYPTLSDVLASVREVLAEHDCVITQVPSGTPDGLTWTLTTCILHKDGEWIEFDPYTRPQVKDEQGFGGALTYGRRYSLTSIFAIGVADDDAADVTEQQRNVQKYDGARTPEEFAIRTMMRTFPRHPLFIDQFKAEFGHGLSDLAVQHHGTALRWVTSFFADPPDPPLVAADGEAVEAAQEVPPTSEPPAASKRQPKQETT
jgi:hypothetical protein